MIGRRKVLLGATATGALLAAGCARSPTDPVPPGENAPPSLDPKVHRVIARTPDADVALRPDAEHALAASRALLAAATAVVVATPDDQTAAQVARDLGVPLLPPSDELAAELDRLQTRTVFAYTEAQVGDRETLPGPATAQEVQLDGLPAQAKPADLLGFHYQAPSPAVASVAHAAGLTLTEVPAPHPCATKEATAAVRAHSGRVVGVGTGFGDEAQFGVQVEVTRTAKEFPAGGVAPLPDHVMIALYGHPGTAALGMMGEQPPAQAVQRLNRLVEEYRKQLPDQHVMGAFEIIATIASGAAGADGDYSAEATIETLQPFVDAAEQADFYVVLDLQPGRTDFVTQARRYEELLKRPHVGLALDPEWRLPPNGKHLVQVGQVDVAEVNQVGTWLADFVQQHKLPPKVLTLHQFQTRMITNRERLDTTRPEVQHLVHVDGQGGQGAKQGTWAAIKQNLPARTWLGWKNFEDEDQPMLTPQQTIAQVKPLPNFISYQ